MKKIVISILILIHFSFTSYGNDSIKLPNSFFIDCTSNKMGRHIFFINQKERKVEQKSPETDLFVIHTNDINELIFNNGSYTSVNYKFNKWTGILSKQPPSLRGQHKTPSQLFDKCKILKVNLKPLFK